MNSELPEYAVREAIHSALGESRKDPRLSEKARQRIRESGPRRRWNAYMGATVAAAVAVMIMAGLAYEVVRKPAESPRPAMSIAPTFTPATPSTPSTPGAWRLGEQSSFPAPGGFVMAYSPDAREVIAIANGHVLGTFDRNPVTYAWNGTSWRAIDGAMPDVNLGPFGMAYDPASHQLIAVLGQGNSVFTWKWSGNSWTPLNSAVSPPDRRSTSLAYDPVSRRLIMFGGFTQASRVLGDTWAWDGSTWTQLHPAASPSPRMNVAMGTDFRTGHIVLAGGVDTPSLGAKPFAGDTWTWNGSNWIRKTTAAKIETTQNVMTVGPDGDLLLFGAVTSSTGHFQQSQQWRWTGEDWEAQAQAPAPPDLLPGAFDNAMQQTLGLQSDKTGYVYSTWLLGGAAPPPMTLSQAQTIVEAKGYGDCSTQGFQAAATLHVLVCGHPGAATGRGLRAFFFTDHYLGTDAPEDSNTVWFVSGSDATITVSYRLYKASDGACCPSLGTADVRFHWDGATLVAQDPVPTADYTKDGHR